MLYDRRPTRLAISDSGCADAIQNVCLEAIGYTLPEEIVTSAEIEARLAAALRAAAAARRAAGADDRHPRAAILARGMLPSEKSIESGREGDPARRRHRSSDEIGALMHGSVCRDFLEPATACGVHHGLGLPRECAVYDVSNACLGIAQRHGASGQHDRAGADSRRAWSWAPKAAGRWSKPRSQHLNADTSLTRNDIKLAVASLTIGSGSAAIVLVRSELSRTGNRLLAATARANTRLARSSVPQRPRRSGRRRHAAADVDRFRTL